MNFGKIDHWILLGGGELLCEYSLKLKKKGFDVTVVTSQRHVDEPMLYPVEASAYNVTSVTPRRFLKKHSVYFIISRDVNTDCTVMSKVTKQTIGVSMGAAWVFKEPFINCFQGRLVNLHPSRLPHDRGGGPWSWKVLKGDGLGCNVIHQVDKGLDTGNVIRYQNYFYPSSCRLPTDYQKVTMEEWRTLLDRFIEEVSQRKEFIVSHQVDYLSSYWPRFATAIHGYIDWSWRLGDIERFICAFDDPYSGAMTFMKGKKVRMKKCFSTIQDGIFHPFQKGMIYRIQKKGILIATEEGSLIVASLFDEEGVDVLYRVKEGDRFFTPIRYLETAKQYRASYNAQGLLKKMKMPSVDSLLTTLL